MPLNEDEDALFKRLLNDQHKFRNHDILCERYYEGEQRLEHIGLAVPPELRRFEHVINVPRMAVDEVERRLDVKSLILPGEDVADKGLRELWEDNNLDSESPILHSDVLTYGRGFVTVAAAPDDAATASPFIRVESPRDMHILIDPWRRRTDAAMRLYRDPMGRDDKATLYLPNATIWLERQNGGRWKEVDRGEHTLGRVPVVMFLNTRNKRAKNGDRWVGRSEMKDTMGMTDAIARTLTNLSLATETHAVPMRYVVGANRSDFMDENGDPLPQWEAYMDVFRATENENAKIGQLSASDLKNFHETVNNYLAWCATVTGLPTRYMGQQTVNPAAEGAIRADEARLVKNTERKQTSLGDAWGWAVALGQRIKTGEEIQGNRVRVEWHDAGTPTFSQKADALTKMAGGKAIISRHGAWDELGWSDARKQREDEYFALEAAEDTLALQKAVNEV